MNPIVEMDADALSRAIHGRQVSCREVMQAYLAQIERFNPQVNALVVAAAGRRSCWPRPTTATRQLDQGQSRGWMHGMPQALKDLAATPGMRTTMGSPLFHELSPQHDAIMRGAGARRGAIIIGKTNTPEFGLGSQTYNTRVRHHRQRLRPEQESPAAAAAARRWRWRCTCCRWPTAAT